MCRSLRTHSARIAAARNIIFVALTGMTGVASLALAQAAFEVPGKLAAGELLTDIKLQTVAYGVDEVVTNDGVMNHFDISSMHGPYFVTGNELARERIHEIGVIGALEEARRSEAYLEGLKKAGKSTLESAKILITEPIKTLSNVPAGVGRFFGNAYRSTKSERRGQYQDSAIKEAIGFADVKRRLAFELGVDPYTSNAALQDALTDVAWADYAGGMSLAVVRTVTVPDSVRSPILLGKVTVRASELVRDESPESLQQINTNKLKEIGASQQQIDALLTNGWYSPSRQTVLTEALHQMKSVKGIAGYLDRAVQAASEEEAFFMQRSAELLSAYATTQGSLKELYSPGALPVAEAQNDAVVLVLAVDHLCWTAKVQTAVTAIREDLPSRLAGAPIELWLGGQASKLAAAELGKMGFVVKQDALKSLLGASAAQ